MRTLVLYVFHEHNERVEQFVRHAIFEDADVDFVVICNGEHLVVTLPPYVECIRRPNIGYDFGAWSHALLLDAKYKRYDAFICVNSSVIGPFVYGRWTDMYVNGLTDDVRLFGSTINTQWLGRGAPQNISMDDQPIHNSHVQSYIFAMKIETLEYLIACEIFSLTRVARTFTEAIEKEVGMSRRIIRNNWNIGSRMNLYAGVDFRFRTKQPRDYALVFQGDLAYPRYLHKAFTPEELIFIKGNRA